MFSLLSFIPEAYFIYVRIGAIIVVLLTAFTTGWEVKGWKDDKAYKDLQIEQALQVDRALIQAKKDHDEAQARSDSLEKQLREEQDHAQTLSDRLHHNIGNGTVKLSIPTTCMSKTSNTARTINQARTELDPTTANDLVTLTDSRDKIIRDCNALIDIVK